MTMHAVTPGWGGLPHVRADIRHARMRHHNRLFSSSSARPPRPCKRCTAAERVIDTFITAVQDILRCQEVPLLTMGTQRVAYQALPAPP